MVMIVDVDAGVFSGGTGATQCVLSKMYRYRSTFPGQLIGSAVFCRTANSAPAQCKKKYTRKKSRCNGVNGKRTKGLGKGIGMGEVSLAVPSVVGGSRENLGKAPNPGELERVGKERGGISLEWSAGKLHVLENNADVGRTGQPFLPN